MSHAILDFGKVDYSGWHGRKINRVTIEITLTDERLSIVGAIWNGPGTDHISSGQNREEITRLFPDDAKVARIVEVWHRWHLNDMHAGTPAQEALLAEHKDEFPGYPVSHYDWACTLLEAHGLLRDDGYKYGSAWLSEPLPAEIRAEVQGWIDEANAAVAS